jgi:hypothetical protein
VTLWVGLTMGGLGPIPDVVKLDRSLRVDCCHVHSTHFGGRCDTPLDRWVTG